MNRIMDSEMNFSNELLHYLWLNNARKVRAILRGVNPCELVDRSGCTLLHISAQYGNVAPTQYFIDKGCNVNAVTEYGSTPLIFAAKSGSMAVIYALLRANANNVLAANENGECAAKIIFDDLGIDCIGALTILLKKVKEECSNDSVLTAKKLLEFNCLIPQVIYLRDKIVTEYMLQNGSDVNKSDPRYEPGCTALPVKLLVEYGADVNAKNYKDGRTALMEAVQNNNIQIMKCLLKRGAIVNATDKSGNVALLEVFHNIHVFAEGNRLDIRLKCIELLLMYGADPQWIQNSTNQSFLEIVERKEIVLVKPILAHLAMMEASGCEIKNLIRSKIDSEVAFKSYFNDCKETIGKFQRAMIYQSISMFDFIATFTKERIAIFARNSDFILNLKKILCSTRYSSIYYHKLFRKIAKEQIHWAYLRNKAFDFLSKIRGFNNNLIIIEIVIGYFDENDLKIIALV